jgi:hypothetical protein
MAIARGFKPKAALEPHEKLCCAYFHLIRGLSQHDLAGIYGGVNPGRVNDAIKDVARALKWPERTGQKNDDEAG